MKKRDSKNKKNNENSCELKETDTSTRLLPIEYEFGFEYLTQL